MADYAWALQLANLVDPTDAPGEVNLKAAYIELNNRLAQNVEACKEFAAGQNCANLTAGSENLSEGAPAANLKWTDRNPERVEYLCNVMMDCGSLFNRGIMVSDILWLKDQALQTYRFNAAKGKA